MASRSQEENNREWKLDREPGAEYYLGQLESEDGPLEGVAPYKLEPDASEIEDFLTRLRQEGL